MLGVLDEKMLHQLRLEKLYSKNQLLPRIRREFMAAELDFRGQFADWEIPEAFGWDLLAQMALHKRALLPTLVGLLRHHAGGDSQSCANLLSRAAYADLVDWSQVTQQFIVRFTLSADVQEELDKYQFPLPMVVPPKPLKGNRDSGYLQGKGSLILKDNHHDDDICLDHLNRVNQIPLSLDLEVASMVQNSWRDLDKAKDGESRQEFERRKKAFDKYDRTAQDVIGELLEQGNRFYLTHKVDKRGRTYCQGYHVSYQSHAWNKAVISFAEQEIVA